MRGSWLTKGTKFGINRKAATKNDLTAVVSTTAPWLIEQETKTIITPRKASSLGNAKDMAARVKAGSNEESEEHPEHDQTQVEVWQRDHLSATGERQAAHPLCPCSSCASRRPRQQRVHLVNTATETINKMAVPVMAGMMQAGDTKRIPDP